MRKHLRVHQRGLSLVELMVAMLIGLFLMGSVIQVVVNSKSTFISERELAVLQEGARYATEHLTREIRMAGYQGCAMPNAKVANSVIGAAGNWSLDAPGLQGFEHEAGNYPTELGTVWPGTDAVVIRRGDTADLAVSKHNANAASIHLNVDHDIKQGEILAIVSTDCTQVGVFQMSKQNQNNTNKIVVHNKGDGDPGNCTKKLGGDFSCTGAGEPSGASSTPFPKGSSVMRMKTTAYYIAASSSADTLPALYARRLVAVGGVATTVAEELVTGVENMQILYGVDAAGGDGVADRYVKADSTLLDNDEEWKSVVSVRISLRMRSTNPVYSEDVAYDTFDGVAGTDGSDRFLRKTVTTTINVRNQGVI